MIDRHFIEQLKMACDIRSIMENYVTFKRSGRNVKCLCPFHLEKTPSCCVFEDTQSFYCFGCGAGGDVITFIMRIENLNYQEAVEWLANRVGLPLPMHQGDDLAIKVKKKIFEMNRIAAKFYHFMLYGDKGKKARAYFAGRGLKKSTILSYGLGYAGNEWTALRDHLKSFGFSYEEMEAADLVIKSRKNQTYYDKFRNRILFPIIDLQGNVIAFGGRIIEEGTPKYLNTSDTPVFKKKHHLFSLNFAKNSGAKNLILGEGYMDVISMYQAGFHNAVATLGTSLTSEQTQLISRYCEEVVIAYDSDEAGKKATQRASQLFEKAGVRAKVLLLSPAKDPDEFIKKFGRDRFKILLEQSDYVSAAFSKQLKEKYDLDDPDEKTQYIYEQCRLILKMTDFIQQEAYISKLAEETNTPKEILKQKLQQMQLRQGKQQRKIEWKQNQDVFTHPNKRKKTLDSLHIKEIAAQRGVLYFLFHNPDYLQTMEEKITPIDFSEPLYKKAYEFMRTQIKQYFSIDISIFHFEFSAEEISELTGIFNETQKYSNAPAFLQDCLQVLIDARHQMSDDEVKEMPAEYLEKIRLEKRKKKA